MRIRYLGQCGFLFSAAATTILVDPYLSDSIDRLPGFPEGFWKRSYLPPLAPSQLDFVNLVLCTHAHPDHADLETLRSIAQASPTCLFGGPKNAANVFLEAGIGRSRMFIVDSGVTHHFQEIEICPIAVPHEEYEQDEEGHHAYLGYLIKWAGLTIFHGGDMLATPEIQCRLSSEEVDIAFLPINGRNDERQRMGIAGNMTIDEAIQFSADCGFHLVVPTHYDLYPNNGASLQSFAQAWADHPLAKTSRWKSPFPGEEFHVYAPVCNEEHTPHVPASTR